MKRNYDFFVSLRNQPNKSIYSIIIGLAYFFLGVNLILTYRHCLKMDSENLIQLLLGGVMFMFLSPVFATDNRREMRGIIATAGTCIVYLFSTALLGVSFNYYNLYLVCAIEITVIGVSVVVMIYIKKRIVVHQTARKLPKGRNDNR